MRPIGLIAAAVVGLGCPFEETTPVAGTTGASPTAASTATAPTGTGLSDVETVETTGSITDVDGTTVGLDDTAGSSTDDGEESTSTGEMTGTDTGPEPPDFFDDFNRPDAPVLGNGWVEKFPGAFQITAGEVVYETGANSLYYNNLFFRPPIEGAADIEIAVDFDIVNFDDNNEPHIVVRAQPDTFILDNPYNAYILVPRPSLNDLCIMRFIGAAAYDDARCEAFVEKGELLEAGETYRLILRVEGGGPVNLVGRLEHRVNGMFEEILMVNWSDESPAAIVDSGTWGISGGTEGVTLLNYSFDNARAVLLDGP